MRAAIFFRNREGRETEVEYIVLTLLPRRIILGDDEDQLSQWP